MTPSDLERREARDAFSLRISVRLLVPFDPYRRGTCLCFEGFGHAPIPSVGAAAQSIFGDTLETSVPFDPKQPNSA